MAAAAAVMESSSSRTKRPRDEEGEEDEEEGSREIDKMFKDNRWEDPAYRLNYFCLKNARAAAVFVYAHQVIRVVDARFLRTRHLKRKCYDEDDEDAKVTS